MRVEIYGLTFDSPGVTFYLWSGWRATALEHKLFNSVQSLSNTQFETFPDEERVHVTDAKTWRAALQAVARVMKGWQEDASDAGTEKRSWRWLLETDTDTDGYDHAGEPTSMWGFLRLYLDRGSPGEEVKAEDIDLEGFGLRIWGEKTTR
jgi:hypothetical protein